MKIGANRKERLTRLTVIVLAVALTAGYYLQLHRSVSEDVSELAELASEYMHSAMSVILEARTDLLSGEEFAHDINGTGLIGLSWSEITTSGGNLEAKRTASDPLWAAAAVRWFSEAGLSAGDVVAASFSGSFPGLNLAVLSAVRAMNLNLVAISSVGASNYGANHPEFTWLDMELALLNAGWPADYLAQATAMGGASDLARNLEEEGQQMIRSAMNRRGVQQLLGNGLADMSRARLNFLEQAAGGQPIALYVNVGGASASTGYCPDWIDIGHGFLSSLPNCPGGTQGVMHEMLARGVPVLHLLNVRQLAAQERIPIDRRFQVHGRHDP